MLCYKPVRHCALCLSHAHGLAFGIVIALLFLIILTALPLIAIALALALPLVALAYEVLKFLHKAQTHTCCSQLAQRPTPSMRLVQTHLVFVVILFGAPCKAHGVGSLICCGSSASRPPRETPIHFILPTHGGSEASGPIRGIGSLIRRPEMRKEVPTEFEWRREATVKEKDRATDTIHNWWLNNKKRGAIPTIEVYAWLGLAFADSIPGLHGLSECLTRMACFACRHGGST